MIDTHIALWAILEDSHLSAKARNILENKENEIYYSTVSVWETTIKHIIRPKDVLLDGRKLEAGCEGMGFICLPIINRRAVEIDTLSLSEDAPAHSDPFDRLLLAQAKAEGMKFLTHDSRIPYYNEDCVIAV